jgi:NADPH-dependent curcumin reductase CurA
MSVRNTHWVLASRPTGWVEESNFRMVETEVPPLENGQALVKVHYLSLDPYMRGRMDDTKSYAAPQPLDTVMIGGTVGEVIESRHDKFRPGDMVVGMGGWQQFVVSAASGAVGSVVSQLAKLRGCRAVGFAGGSSKSRYVIDELGFDACIDYKTDGARPAFEAATPSGVDIVFENVGGVFDLALARMNAFGRVALCGLIAGYNGQDIALRNVRSLLVNRLTLQGFIISEHMSVWPEAVKELSGLVASGALKYRESIAVGIENAPQAFIGLLKGENFGKQLVKI